MLALEAVIRKPPSFTDTDNKQMYILNMEA